MAASVDVDVVDLVAIIHGGVTLGLALGLLTTILASSKRWHVLPMATSYLLLTGGTVYAAAKWSRLDSPLFWIYATAWAIGDIGLLVYRLRLSNGRIETRGGR